MRDVAQSFQFQNNLLAIGDEVLKVRRGESAQRIVTTVIERPKATMDEIIQEVYQVPKEASERLLECLRKRCTKMMSRLRRQFKEHFDSDGQRQWQFFAFDHKNFGYHFCLSV